MPVVIEPKNIFDKNISRLNDNAINSIENIENVMSGRRTNIYDVSEVFYDESLVEKGFGFSKIQNIQKDSILYDVAYKFQTYNIGEDEYEYDDIANNIDELTHYVFNDINLFGYICTYLKRYSSSKEETYYKGKTYFVRAYNNISNISNIIRQYAGSNGIIIDMNKTNRSVISYYVFYTTREQTDSYTTYTLDAHDTFFDIRIYKYLKGRQAQNNYDYVFEKSELSLDSNSIIKAYNGTKINRVSVDRAYRDSIAKYLCHIEYNTQYPVDSDIEGVFELQYTITQNYTKEVPFTIHSGQQTGTVDYIMEEAHHNDYYPLITSCKVIGLNISGSVTDYPPHDNTYTYIGSGYYYQGDNYVDESAATTSLNELLCGLIVDNYTDGKSTAVLNCSIDNYYEGVWDAIKQEYVADPTQKVISKNGSDNLPMYFKNNDIVVPKRVKMVRKSDGSMEQEECDLVEGKIFRVVGVRIKYDGRIMQELTLQEEKS